MKYIFSIFGLICAVCGFVFCGQSKPTENEYVRLHITANSSSVFDQNVKYQVKDAIVNFINEKTNNLTSKIANKQEILSDLDEIEEIVCTVLMKNNAPYTASVIFCEEEYPTRSYSNGVLEGGMYPSLKIDLGEAQGENWWCCIMPTVCFV